jgi:phosphate transport system protein
VVSKQIHESGRLQIPRLADIRRAGGIVVGMLRKALDAFARLDAVAAAEVIRDDAAIDEAFRGIMRQLITFMMEDPRTISTALEIVWVARAIERMGDHSKNLAEQVIYIVKGTDVRHTSFENVERKASL